MTDRKRFKLINGIKKGTHSGIWDNQKQHNQGIGDELWIGEVVSMLNEGVTLAEENEQLKTVNTHLKNELSWIRDYAYWKEKDAFNKLWGAYMETCEEYRILVKENEQLKSKYSEQCTQLDFLKDENKHMRKVLEENKKLKELVIEVDNELGIRDIVCGAGKFRLEEWGKHRYHQFYKGDEELEDETVVIMLMELEKENKELQEENEQLKFQNSNLMKEVAEYSRKAKEERDTAMKLGNECDNLTIKNQKLELEIQRLEMIIKTGKR